MRSAGFIILIAFLGWSCQNIDSAPASKRNTFIHLYEGLTSYAGVLAKEIPGGYLVLGNSVIYEDSVISFIITTDLLGNEITTTTIPDLSAKSLTILKDGSGYILVGDSIEIIPGADPAANTEIYSTKILKVSNTGSILKTLRITDRDTAQQRVKIDYKASSVTVNEFNQVLLLGTYKGNILNPERPFLASFDPNLTTLLWTQNYDLLDRNYVNGKSVHYSNGKIVWASAILKPQGAFNDSYLSVPLIQENSIFLNDQFYKENESQLLLAGDIQPAFAPEFGFGVIGTYGTTGGTETNMVFLRLNQQGSLIPGSPRYFDGLLSEGNLTLPLETDSQTEDQGLALASTSDGGFILAGSVLSTPTFGSGLRDIYLVKVDANGNPLWNKIMGGTGDEVVSSIIETQDGGLLFCGTNTLGGFSNVFLIKTDAFGNLRN